MNPDRWAVLIVFLLTVPVAAVGIVLLARVRGGDSAAWRRSLAEGGMIWTTWPWLWLILMPQDAGSTVHLMPLIDLAAQFETGGSELVVQLTGNLLAFAGFGYFAAMRWTVRPWTIAAIVAAGSIGVETIQYVADLGRVSSIDDVLVNTGGAWAAAVISAHRRRSVLIAPITP